ncbi:hypothetical protein BV20DRAFT_1116829 [Pilatotrama ljubarskyi]|nr:hypothetical protein BV20DRAFT_1116829 [Pilatotrama ljubarskyi]
MSPFQRGPSAPPRPTAAQAALQDQLAVLSAQALEISTRLNALSLTARLPPEILSEIFLTHAARVQREQLDSVMSDRGCMSRVSSYFKWIYVAHVCRHWRAVALACAEFRAFRVFEAWTVPQGVLFGPEPDKTRGFPLTVVYHQNVQYHCERCTTWYESSFGLQEIQRLFPRIRHLVIVIEEDSGLRELWEYLSQASESLETLRIGLRGNAWSYHTADEGSKLTLPNGLFASRTPRLRSLTTSYVSFSWSNTLLCSSLRHLEISGHPGHQGETDLGEFIATLATMSSLETLVIDCLPKAGQPVDVVAFLPNLRLLRMITSLGHAASFLSCLRFPLTTSVSLSLQNREDTPAEFSVFVQAFSRIVQEAPLHTLSWTVPPESLCLQDEQDESCLRAWAGSTTAVENLWVSGPDVIDVIPRLTVTERHARYTEPLLAALSLPHLKAVHLSGAISSQEQWQRAFAGAPNVALVRFSGRVGDQLGTSLSQAMVVTTRGRAECAAPIMPHLRTLQFSNVRLSSLRANAGLEFSCCCDDYEESREHGGKKTIDMEDLVRGIERRRRLGADEIERIEFVDCTHMKMSHMQPLLREISTVVSDGAVLETAACSGRTS